MGREGEGPGEFGYQRVPHGNWIAASDTSFIVLGLTTGAFVEFGNDGTLLGSLTQSPPYPFSITRFTMRDGRLFYSVDQIARDTGARVLETWRLEQHQPHTLLRVDTMPPVPLWRGQPLSGTLYFDQANPLWTFDGHCAYVSDGGSDAMLRIDLASGRADTIRLPSWPIPERTAEDTELLDRMHAEVKAMGGDPRGPDVDPTLRVKWVNIVLDPDGFVWVEPWRPYSYRDQPLTALVVDPTTGAVDSVRVPRVPAAFLPDTGFVALVSDASLDIPIVERYETRRHPGRRN
jgi:hypothetical protein